MIQYDGQGSGDDFYGTFWYAPTSTRRHTPRFRFPPLLSLLLMPNPPIVDSTHELLSLCGTPWPQAPTARLHQQPRRRPRRPHGHPRIPLRLPPAVTACAVMFSLKETALTCVRSLRLLLPCGTQMYPVCRRGNRSGRGAPWGQTRSAGSDSIRLALRARIERTFADLSAALYLTANLTCLSYTEYPG
jgi:hypothetical protein